MFETIVALATPAIKSALGIVRLSGDDCFFVVNKFFTKKIEFTEENKIIYGFIKDDKEIIDEVVLLAYKGPHSFTGEDSIEIICHGSVLIENKIIETALKYGARLATHGEYSSRRYLHHKTDLIQAESINDLINAESNESKNLSLMSVVGETSKLISPIKADFGQLLSNIEVNIDYPEYTDIEDANFDMVVKVCKKNKDYIENLIKNGKKGQIIKDGINVAIVGKPNVGKSSILNALLNEDKAIVTDIKGTTRDIVEGHIIIEGVSVNLFDTAGIRESEDKIENIGIEKSQKEIENADIVLAVFDSTTFDDEDKKIEKLVANKNTIYIYNKADLIMNKNDKKLYVSAISKNVDLIKKEIIKKLNLKKENYINPSINNTRELGILSQINEKITKVIQDCNNSLPIDIIATEIKEIFTAILSLTGEDYDFDIAKEIFSRFCIGK